MKTRDCVAILLSSVVCIAITPDFSWAQSGNNEIAKASSDIPIVKSAALHPNLSVPWSKPVQVVDPFEGQFLAVFDRDYVGGRYGGDRKVISAWSRDKVQILLNVRQERCDGFYSWRSHSSFGSSCLGIDIPRTVKTALLKVGGQVLTLTGDNGKFVVDAATAASLKNAPEEDIILRLVVEGGESVDSKIDKRTVKAWRSIY
jgi:hypothetical protein